MTYKETLNWMFNKLPVYQLIGATAYKTGLDNTIPAPMAKAPLRTC